MTREDETTAPLHPSRRRALKVAGGAAIGAVIWAEPTIKGLARRPAYAANGSVTEASFTMLVTLADPADELAPTITPGSFDPFGFGSDLVFEENFANGAAWKRPRFRLLAPNSQSGGNQSVRLVSATITQQPATGNGGVLAGGGLINGGGWIRWEGLNPVSDAGTYTLSVNARCL